MKQLSQSEGKLTGESNKVSDIKSLTFKLCENCLESVVWCRDVVVRTTQACTS